uniref:Uncharacterized protein n=1 Tax=mine drainage metagenome TaxID=410659 RepID=E6Q0S6_9ZZZZ
MLKVRDEIPWVLGQNTYIYATIAANGGILRQTDILVSLGPSASRIDQYDVKFAGMLRTFRIQTLMGRGSKGLAIMFDERFPLYKEVFALARTISKLHPIPVDDRMPDEKPPAPSTSSSHNINMLAGSEVNTLVLATVRALRGRAGRVELEASVPHDSLTAVERAVKRLREYGIIAGGDGEPITFADEPWRPQLERLYAAYLRLRPELVDEIRERYQAKKQRKAERSDQGLFGYAMTERILTTLAIHGPMTRVKLRSMTMFTHANKALDPLVNAGILAVQEQLGDKGQGTRSHGTRKRLVVSLNTAFPVHKELRLLLLTLAGKISKRAIQDISDPRPSYDPSAMVNTAPLFWALLMMNAVKDRELNVASLNRLRSNHAPFTLHGRMRWLHDEGYIVPRQQGLVIYYRLNPEFQAYRSLKRLLDAISRVWPDLVDAAQFNDELKPAKRIVQDTNARKRSPRKTQHG